MKLEFEWHELKAEAYYQAHGVSFELTKLIFKDAFAVEPVDDREDYGEQRFIMIGMAEGNVILFVAYTERGERYLSLRHAGKRNMSKLTSSSKRLKPMMAETVEKSTRPPRPG